MSKTLTRRQFLKLVSCCLPASALAACERPIDSPQATTTPATTLITKPVVTPTLQVTPTAEGCNNLESLARTPPLTGIRYNSTVPDTLDLQKCAELTIQAITNRTNPKDNFAPYDEVFLWRNPPVLARTTMFNGKYMEAIALLRSMTGNEYNQAIDQLWRKLFIEMVMHSEYPWWGIDGGRLLAWMGNLYALEQNPCWLKLIDRELTRLEDRFVIKDGYGYFPSELGGSAQDAMPIGWEATYQGWVLQGLVQLYRTSGREITLELAEKLARYLMFQAQVFDDQAHFIARHPSENGPALQFHHNGNALVGVSELALATNNSELADFARSGYEWARTTGSPLVGFFPEYIGDWPDERPHIDCETCCVADMIQLALNLSMLNKGDYWDDIDRYLRNQFVEMQMQSGEWINRMAATLPPTPVAADEDSGDVAERAVGSFASWAYANDFYGNEGSPGATFCCTGNAGRAISLLWRNMLNVSAGELTVHLLINRASHWADINSCLPIEGRVDIQIKQPCSLAIRLPEWVIPGEVSCQVNESQTEPGYHGRYALVDRVEKGSLVSFFFPINIRTVREEIGDMSYTLDIKGNEVISISPNGKWCPLYQRQQYKGDQVQWVQRERFLAENCGALPS